MMLLPCQECKRMFPSRYSLSNHRRWHSSDYRQMMKKQLKKTPEQRRLIGEANKGEKNGQWKGENVGYIAIHDYIKYHKSKPDTCDECGRESKRLDLANISQQYKRDLEDWEWLCRRCHMQKDGRINKRDANGRFCGEDL